jgi:hypothetical protein
MSEQGEAGIEEAAPRSAPLWLVYGGVAGGVVLIFGLVTWLLGLGPFAYRQIFYGTSEIYVLNMTGRPVVVTLDRGTGLKVGPEAAERTPILGGTTRLVTRDEAGAVIEELEVFVDGKPIFYNVQGERCLALSDVSSFYLPGREKGVEIKEVFEKGTTLVHLPHERMIWPRQTLRDQVINAEQGVGWIEIVACPLLDPEERAVLEGHLDAQLTERKQKEQDEAKMREMQRRMLMGGGEAVDEAFGLGPKGAGAAGDVDAGDDVATP